MFKQYKNLWNLTPNLLLFHFCLFIPVDLSQKKQVSKINMDLKMMSMMMWLETHFLYLHIFTVKHSSNAKAVNTETTPASDSPTGNIKAIVQIYNKNYCYIFSLLINLFCSLFCYCSSYHLCCYDYLRSFTETYGHGIPARFPAC